MSRLMFILAQTRYENRLKGFRGAFDNRQTDPTDIIVIGVYFAVLAAFVAVLIVFKRCRGRADGGATLQQPHRFFSRVMKQMGIGLGDRWMMRAVSRSARMQQPVTLFFNPGLFQKSTGRWLDSITLRPLRTYAEGRLRAISDTAFPQAVAANTE